MLFIMKCNNALHNKVVLVARQIVSCITPCTNAVLVRYYADKVQVYMYMHCLSHNAISAVWVMSGTLEAPGAWMSSNRLRLIQLRLNLSGWACQM